MIESIEKDIISQVHGEDSATFTTNAGLAPDGSGLVLYRKWVEVLMEQRGAREAAEPGTGNPWLEDVHHAIQHLYEAEATSQGIHVAQGKAEAAATKCEQVEKERDSANASVARMESQMEEMARQLKQSTADQAKVGADPKAEAVFVADGVKVAASEAKALQAQKEATEANAEAASMKRQVDEMTKQLQDAQTAAAAAAGSRGGGDESNAGEAAHAKLQKEKDAKEIEALRQEVLELKQAVSRMAEEAHALHVSEAEKGHPDVTDPATQSHLKEVMVKKQLAAKHHARAAKAEVRLTEARMNYDAHRKKLGNMSDGPAKKHEEDLCSHFEKEINARETYTSLKRSYADKKAGESESHKKEADSMAAAN